MWKIVSSLGQKWTSQTNYRESSEPLNTYLLQRYFCWPLGFTFPVHANRLQRSSESDHVQFSCRDDFPTDHQLWVAYLVRYSRL